MWAESAAVSWLTFELSVTVPAAQPRVHVAWTAAHFCSNRAPFLLLYLYLWLYRSSHCGHAFHCAFSCITSVLSDLWRLLLRGLGFFFKDPDFVVFALGMYVTVSDFTFHTNTTKMSTMTVFHHALLFLRPGWRVEGSAGSISSWGCEESSWLLHIPTLQQPRSCLPYFQKGPDLCSHQAALRRYGLIEEELKK